MKWVRAALVVASWLLVLVTVFTNEFRWAFIGYATLLAAIILAPAEAKGRGRE